MYLLFPDDLYTPEIPRHAKKLQVDIYHNFYLSLQLAERSLSYSTPWSFKQAVQWPGKG